MAFCNECGSEVAPNDVFCPYCGIALQTSANASHDEIEPVRKPLAASENQPELSPEMPVVPAVKNSQEKKSTNDLTEPKTEDFSIDFEPSQPPVFQNRNDEKDATEPNFSPRTGGEMPDKRPENPINWTDSMIDDNILDVSDAPQNTEDKTKIDNLIPQFENHSMTENNRDENAQKVEADALPKTDSAEKIDFSQDNAGNEKVEKSDFETVNSASEIVDAGNDELPGDEIKTAVPEQTENPVIDEEIFKSAFNEPVKSEIAEPDFNLTIPYVPPKSGESFDIKNNFTGEPAEILPVDQDKNQSESPENTERTIESPVSEKQEEKVQDEPPSAVAPPIFKPEDNLDLHVSEPPVSQFDSVRIMETPAYNAPNDEPAGAPVETENKNEIQPPLENPVVENRQNSEFEQTPSADLEQAENNSEGTIVAPTLTAPVATENTDGKKAAKLKPLDEGTILNNRYEVIRKIGGGGMGAVYLASDNNLGGVLRAVKEMVQSYIEETQQDKAINDFKRESMILSTLDHPAIPTIYDYFYDDKESRFYLVMKYINGGDLSTKLRSTPAGKIDEKTVTEWGIQLADVLDYLHNRPTTIVYRDLKPSNVMIDGNSGRAMLIDFGIARSVNKEEKGVTAVGTMGYAPPELFSGNVEPRSDIYSLGSTMFHLMTGADPQSNPLLIFDFQKNPRPRQINSQLSDQMERILMRSVEYNADARFASAAEMRQALQEHLDNLKANNVTYGVKEAPQVVGLEDQPVFCGFCGQRIMATDMFCAFCGAKQPLSQHGVHSEIYSRSALMPARIVINGTNELAAATFDLDKDQNLIGRRDPMSNIFPELDLSKYDPQTKVSRRHALIKVSGGSYSVEDLGSSNGTLLTTGGNSVRLLPHQPQSLTDGDKIRVGDTILNFYAN